MLFAAANQYAPGEAGTPTNVGEPGWNNVNLLGRYTQAFQEIDNPTRVWIGVIGLAVIAYLVHKHGGRR